MKFAALDGTAIGLAKNLPDPDCATEIVAEALKFSHSRALEQAGTLRALVEERFGDLASSSGALGRLHGYVGETLARNELVAKGLGAEFAPTSNTEGWDLVVNDGTLIQVKTGSSAGPTLDHLEAHPDIPVLASPEIAVQLDNGAVEGLDVLRGTNIEDITARGLENIATGAMEESMVEALLDVGVPLITIATSSWREIGLLVDNKTDWSTAGKNVAVDAASVGGGATAGAAFGSATLPLVGTAIGAVMGAMCGKMIADYMRTKGFRDALGRHDDAIKSLRRAVNDSNRNISTRLPDLVDGADAQLDESIQAAAEQLRAVHRGHALLTEASISQADASASIMAERDWLASLRNTFREHYRGVLGVFRGLAVWRYLRRRRSLRHLESCLEAAEVAGHTLGGQPNHDLRFLERWYAYCAVKRGVESPSGARLLELHRAHRVLAGRAARVRNSVRLAWRSHVSDLLRQMTELANEHSKKIRKVTEHVFACRTQVRQEAEKIGVRSPL